MINCSLLFVACVASYRLSHDFFRSSHNKNNATHLYHGADTNVAQTASASFSGVIKKKEGHDVANGATWKLVDWQNPISEEEESKFNCLMTPFISSASSKEAQICVHTFNDFITNTIKSDRRWYDCNILPELWNNRKMDDGHGGGNSYYVEVGANIGSCVLEMLLSTNANIIAFEPHPMNVYNLKKTMSQLDKSYQDRLMLFPIGLGDSPGQSTIYSANDNMGNSG